MSLSHRPPTVSRCRRRKKGPSVDASPLGLGMVSTSGIKRYEIVEMLGACARPACRRRGTLQAGIYRLGR